MKSLIIYLFIVMCMAVLTTCVSYHHMCAGPWGTEGALDPLGLEL